MNSATRSKAWRAANPEAVVANNKAWRATNPEINAARLKAYRKANSEAIAASRKVYYGTHREAVLLVVAEYGKANLEARAATQRKRRARKASATGSFTVNEWVDLRESYGNRCLCCGQREGDISIKNGSSIKITPDHVIPLARGGSNSIDNIQPLCVPCNASKGARRTTDYRDKGERP